MELQQLEKTATNGGTVMTFNTRLLPWQWGIKRVLKITFIVVSVDSWNGYGGMLEFHLSTKFLDTWKGMALFPFICIACTVGVALWVWLCGHVHPDVGLFDRRLDCFANGTYTAASAVWIDLSKKG